MKRWSMFFLLSCVLLIGCAAPSPRSGGFNADDPAAKLYAIVQAGQVQDQTSVAPLVEQLDSDDPLVRVMAINALQRITGTRLGYNPYMSAVDRQVAIQKWVKAVHQKDFGQAGPGP